MFSSEDLVLVLCQEKGYDNDHTTTLEITVNVLSVFSRKLVLDE